MNGKNDNVRGEDDNGDPVPRTVDPDLLISQSILTFFDSTQVYLKRGSNTYLMDAADIHNINANNNRFNVKQGATGGTTLIEGAGYEFQTGDTFFVKVKGKALSGYDDNIVAIARDILISEAGVLPADLDTAKWDYFQNKAAPPESAILNIKGRVWLQEAQEVIQYVLSLLEQVRLEMFQDRNLKLSLSSTHFDEFDDNPSYQIDNFDLEKDSLQPTLDQLTNFNRLQGQYNLLPDLGKQAYQTSVFRNQASIDQAGKEIYKLLIFPNLYEVAAVEYQVEESLKIASAFFERIQCTLTWRSLLLDIGDFVKLNVQIGATIYEGVPCLLREIGYNPQGVKLPVKLWSFQLCPFGAYNPSIPGIVGGENAVIIKE